jgi:hypothetical protein
MDLNPEASINKKENTCNFQSQKAQSVSISTLAVTPSLTNQVHYY